MQVARNHGQWRWALLLAVGCLAACGSDTGPTPPPPGGGGGADSTHPFVQPTGTAFALPAGVTVEGKMFGSGPTGACAGLDPVSTSLDFVAVCMTLHNTTDADTTVVLPAGLVLIAKDTEVQNGTQVVPISIRIAPGSDTTIVYSLFCVNQHRLPSGEEDEFTFGPVSDNAGLGEIITLVKDKDVTTSDAADVIQWAIWEVSDGGGLTADTRDQLTALP